MDALRRRWAAGQAVTLAEAFDAARLSGRQRAVVWGRLEGLSFGQLAVGLGCKRQAVQQMERKALRRLGVAAGSIAAAVHAAEADSGAALMRQRALCTQPGF